ncbi:MAG: hypothetical protein JJU36_08960 [Phycisphaeraceae bacterium]|nr:hypothetical protein [Phycisphaeraceae bacterium]
MKITAIKTIKVCGTLTFDGVRHGEPIGTPAHVHEHLRPPHRLTSPKRGHRSFRHEQLWLRVETDQATFGQVGPVSPQAAFIATTSLPRCLIGQDALAHERLWDLMYRTQAHGRTGLGMHAISAVDCALWDHKGRVMNQPVHRLLGGPTRPRIPAYAQTKGMSQHREHLIEQSKALVADGWTRFKVFFNHGPSDGEAGMDVNEATIRTLREHLPESVELMVDAWRSWDLPYALRMLDRLRPYRLSWVEEPLRPELEDAYGRLRGSVSVPIARGEHEYTRWGAASVFHRGGADVYQPDVMWCGGLTEMVKITAVASAAGAIICPHTSLIKPTLHYLAATSPGEASMLEYPVFADTFHAECFLANPSMAGHGTLEIPGEPGLGMEIDEDKIDSIDEVTDAANKGTSP